MWPAWMGSEFSDPGDCGDDADPAGGPTCRWGDPAWFQIWYNDSTLQDGPTGPVSAWGWRLRLVSIDGGGAPVNPGAGAQRRAWERPWWLI